MKARLLLLLLPTLLACEGGYLKSGSQNALLGATSGSLLFPDDLGDRKGEFLVGAQFDDGRKVLAFHNQSQGCLEVNTETSPNSFDFRKKLICKSKSIIGLYNGIAISGKQVHLVTYDKSNELLLYSVGDGSNFAEPIVLDNGERFTEPNGETQFKKHNVGQWASLALDSNGRPHVAYYDATAGELMHASLIDQGWGIEAVVPDDSVELFAKFDIGRYAKIAISGDKVFIAAQNASHADAYLLRGKLAAAGNVEGWQLFPYDTVGDVGSWVNLTLSSTGEPITCYYDNLEGDLKVAWPLQKKIVIADDEGNVGLDCHIQVNAHGNVSVAYLAASGLDLKLVQQTSDGFASRTLDDKGVSGFFPALFLQGDDFAVIYHLSYQNDKKAGTQLEDTLLLWPPRDAPTPKA